MTPIDLAFYALLAAVAVAAATVAALTRDGTRGALALALVAVAVAGLVGAFAGAPLVAVALLLLQGSVAAAIYLVASMFAPTRPEVSTGAATAPRTIVTLLLITGVVLALGFVSLTSGTSPASARGPGADAQAVETPVAGSEATASAGLDDELLDHLAGRYIVSFALVGFVLLAALVGIVEANRVDDGAPPEAGT